MILLRSKYRHDSESIQIEEGWSSENYIHRVRYLPSTGGLHEREGHHEYQPRLSPVPRLDFTVYCTRPRIGNSSNTLLEFSTESCLGGSWSEISLIGLDSVV